MKTLNSYLLFLIFCLSSVLPYQAFSQKTPPPPPNLAFPTDGATGLPIKGMTLVWHSSIGATSYKLQYSKNAAFASGLTINVGPITDSKQTLPDLKGHTKYYWRVAASNDYATSAWSSTWSFTTVVAPPILVSPSNGATGVPIDLTTLTWNTSSGAVSYRLMVSTDPGFASSPAFDQSNITGTSQQLTGLASNTVYYWHVNATNADGTSLWSDAWSFTTGQPPPPPTPTLVSPANAAKGISVAPTLSWKASAGAASYRLQVSTDLAFTPPLVLDQSSITGTSRQVTGLANNTFYYWRVNATNAGGTSTYSSAWTFTTILASPTLALPANGATGVTVPPTLSWNAASGAASYELRVSTSSDFSKPAVDQSGITGTSQQASGLANGTQYYWQVRAANANGPSDWSLPWTFTTVLRAPTLASPANGQSAVSITPTLRWNASGGATSYELRISTSSDFFTSVFDQSSISGTSQQVSGLINNTQYYWQVRAANANGPSDWSAAWSFTTIVATPTLVSPANAATGISVAPTLSWNAVPGADSYRWEVSTYPDFSISEHGYFDGITTGTSQQVSGLANNTRYYWHVYAYQEAGGLSAWSGAWTFTTILAAPTLASPADGAIAVPVPPTLSWNRVPGAASYRLEVSTDPGFPLPLAFGQSNITGTSQQVSGLANNTRYYWRVNATNAGGTSAWSSVPSFTTELAGGGLSLPLNGTVDASTTPTLSWNVSPGATSYQLEVSTASNFAASKIVFNQTNITGTSQQVSGLVNGTTYYWRVNMTYADGTSGWSPTWTFMTVLLAPTLLSPLNGATAVAFNTDFSWNASSGASTYELQVSTTPDFSTIFFDSRTLGFTSWSAGTNNLGALYLSTVYYWRVNAVNAAETSAWSSVWSFSTDIPVPALVSPANAATGVSITPKLSWNASPYPWFSSAPVTSYHVQVSTASNFSASTTVFDQSNITTTSQQLSDLAIGTLYYWRVNATYPSGTSDWSSVSTFTTGTAPPPVPTLLSPANGATAVAINTDFSWNASSGATSYQLQVSTAPDFSTTVFDRSNINGTTRRVNNVLAIGTLYYWRVNATNAGGTSVWSDVWSFSTILAAPTLGLPTSGATGVSIAPTLSWRAWGRATSYQVQVSTVSNFSSTVFNQSNVTGTSQQVSGLAIGTLYYWRVNATYAVGTSDWSEVWSFTTATAPPPVPTLLWPANGATSQPIGLQLSWNASIGARSYQLQVSTAPDFSTTVFDLSNINGNARWVGFDSGTLYYWRVNVTDAGGTSAWSDVWSFSTILATPTLVSPTSGATRVSVTPVLSWNITYDAHGPAPSNAPPESFQVQVSKDPNFLTTVFDQSNITTTSQIVSGLAINTIYYWRVKATTAAASSDWSGAWSFTTTHELPAAPTLVSPLNAATGAPINPTTLTWGASAGAASYQLQVSTASNFSTSTTVFNQSNITGTSQQVSGLANNMLYYWRVIAANADGTSDWSTTWTFTTILATPTLASPANAVTGVSVTPTLSWNASVGAASYRLQVSTDPGFTSPLAFDQSNITGTLQQVSGLANNTLYYWRVNATNAGGTSVYSTAWTFTTILASPMLAFPASGATGVSITPTLSWNATAGAASYRLQVSTDPGFTPPLVLDQNNITATSQQISGLANNTLYYWHVNATNAGGTSAYSGTWSFTTIIAAPVPPTLTSPANAASGVATNPLLTWNAVNGATSYQLQVSVNADLSSPIFDQANITGMSQQVSGLANGTVYYWHVDAKNAGGTSAYSSAWSFTTIIAAPVPPTLASPANAATGVATNPTLTWNAVSGPTSYQLQVSVNADLSSPIFDQADISGTSQQVSGLANGIVYYWHVDAKNAGGTSAWSSAWSFTTSVALAPPTLAIPANGATGVGSSQDFVWYTIPGVFSYRLQIADNPSFTSPFFDRSPLTYGWVVSGLAPNQTYYWRVYALYRGVPSAWSETWSFTTRGAIQDLPQSNSFALEGSIPGDGSWIPATVAGVTRADDSKVRLVVGSGSSGRLYVYVYNGTSYQLEWSDVISPGAEIFPVAVGDADNDGKPEIVVSVWPSGGPSDKKIHLYRWNGTAYAQVMEQQLDFMSWGYLTVAIKDLDGDGQNELVATANQINILRYSQTTNTFQTVWTSPTAAYNFSNGIQVSIGDVDGDGRPEIVASTSIDAFSTNPSSEVGLVIAGFDGSTYSVKAELRGFAQGLGGVAIGDFDGDHQAEMITGVSNYAIGSYPIYCIKHSGSGYTISQIATSPYGMFQAHAADIDGDGIAEADVFRNTNGSYFVKYVAGSYQVSLVPYLGGVVFGDLADADQDGRAEIIGGGQVVGWEPPLVAPVLASPANTATGVATSPTLQWNTVSGATSYNIQLSTDQTFASNVSYGGPVTQTSYGFSGLSFSTTYYWRVYASNASATSPPSAVWSFTTTAFPAPALAIPANISTGIAPIQNIVWYPASGATSYHLQVSLDASFNTTPFIDVPNSWGAWTAYGLALDTVYYWRVNANNGTLTSPWSDTWSFRTMKTIPVLALSDSFQVAAALRLDATQFRSVVAGDTRGDGKVRFVVGTRGTGTLYVCQFDGTSYQVEWSGVIAPGAEIIPTAIGDFDNDGKPEILVNIFPQPGYAPSDGKIHMFRWDGSAYTQVLEQQTNSWACFMPAAVADLDGDGKNELILVDGDIDIFRYSPDSKLFEKVGSIPAAAYNITNSLQVSVGDVDGDGRPEIIALPPVYEYSTNPSAETAMLIIGFNGSSYTVKAQLSGFAHGLGGAAVADFDGDGKMEIITAVGNHNIAAHPIYVVKYNNSAYTITQIGTIYPGTFQVHAGDIDGDGIPDAAIPLNGFGSCFVTFKSGQYQVSFAGGGSSVFSDVADVDGNGKADILTAGYSDVDVISWNPPSSASTAAMRALPGIVAYISKLPDGAFKPPAKDRRHALIDKLNHSQSQYRSGDVASALKTIDQDITSHLVVRKRPANDLWLADQVAQATLLRMIDQLVIAMKNGSATADGVQLADEDSPALPTEYCLYQNYPNPFNPTTQLTFDLPKDGNVSLVVHNILGQEVARLADGYMPAGRYSIAFAADRLSAGVYYYVLKAGDYRSVKKMLLLK